MLRALLVAACLAPAALHWVEISQQHYQKPARLHTYPHHDDDPERPTVPSARVPPDYPEEQSRVSNQRDPEIFLPKYYRDENVRFGNIPKGNRIYLNYSIPEHTWNQNKYSGPSDVTLVDDYYSTLRPNITPEFSLKFYEPVVEKPVDPVLVKRNEQTDQDIVAAIVERVPSKGSVKRVQLSNTPVKTPSGTKAVSPIRRHDIKKSYISTEINHSFTDEFDIKSDIINKAQKESSSYINDSKPIFSGSKEPPVRSYAKITTPATSRSTNEPTIPFRKLTQKTDREPDNGKYRTKTEQNISTYEESNDLDTTTEIKDNETALSDNTYVNADRLNDNLQNINKQKIKTSEVEKENTEFERFSNGPTNVNLNKNKGHISGTNSNEDENHNENNKVNTLENVMKFVKLVAETISKNTNRGVNGKVKYLNELKETLLTSIKERVDATWPDDSAGPPRPPRRSRSATARGHVEFPSSESALMTISFLTFAVFLIKLVLQVIQTYKNKAMVVAPLVVATAGRTLRKLRDLT